MGAFKIHLLWFRSGVYERLVGVYNDSGAAHRAACWIYAVSHNCNKFQAGFGSNGPPAIKEENFIVEARDLIRGLSILNEWDWDYEATLRDNAIIVERRNNSWTVIWEKDEIDLGPINESLARKAAALFISLWLFGISGILAEKLMLGYIQMEQEGKSATAPAKEPAKEPEEEPAEKPSERN